MIEDSHKASYVPEPKHVFWIFKWVSQFSKIRNRMVPRYNWESFKLVAKI